MDITERKYWLAFSSFVGIGPKRFELLVKYFGSAEKAWRAADKEFLEIGLPSKLASSFINYRQKFSPDDYLKWIDSDGVRVLTIEDEEYPKLLKEIGDAPFVLYVKSSKVQGTSDKLEELFEIGIAVVGTRKLTSYGREVTEKLVSDLTANGLTIVSGLARGLDGVAHKTAMETGGRTLAVMGTGINIVYPPEHRDLYEQIAEHGAVISELPMGYPALRMNFPARNRIISGLSLGVLIPEAAEDSGSLITASFAGEQGREVFVVPGPITSPVSAGTNELLKKGAKLVTSVNDILEELEITIKKKHIEAKKVLPANPKEKLILDILSSGQLHINTIVVKSGLPINETGSLLTMMEMKGIVRCFGNGVFGIKS